MMHSCRTFAPILACIAPMVLAACPAPEPTAAEGAAYFGLQTGEVTYSTGNGLQEVHTYTRDDGEREREIYERIARAGGFLVDGRTLVLEATGSSLLLTRYYDCQTRCGELSEPVSLLSWPLKGGEVFETTTSVDFAVNGDPSETRTEDHRIQVNSESSKTVAAGTFDGFDVVWSRSFGDQTETSSFFFAPENGFISIDGFDGGHLERD